MATILQTDGKEQATKCRSSPTMPFSQYYAASHSRVTAYTKPKTKHFPLPKGHFSHHTCSLKTSGWIPKQISDSGWKLKDFYSVPYQNNDIFQKHENDVELILSGSGWFLFSTFNFHWESHQFISQRNLSPTYNGKFVFLYLKNILKNVSLHRGNRSASEVLSTGNSLTQIIFWYTLNGIPKMPIKTISSSKKIVRFTVHLQRFFFSE